MSTNSPSAGNGEPENREAAPEVHYAVVKFVQTDGTRLRHSKRSTGSVDKVPMGLSVDTCPTKLNGQVAGVVTLSVSMGLQGTFTDTTIPAKPTFEFDAGMIKGMHGAAGDRLELTIETEDGSEYTLTLTEKFSVPKGPPPLPAQKKEEEVRGFVGGMLKKLFGK